MIFRAETNDLKVWNNVTSGVEYDLPTRFDAQDVVIDIGAHIGSFSYEVARRGVGRVFAFEADEDNFRIAEHNLSCVSSEVILERAAVCRSDIRPTEMYFGGYERLPGFWNTGGGSVLWAKTGQAVPCRAFDDIVLDASNNGQRRIRLAKFDCEESEWPILFTSRLLHLLDEIIGEFHEIGGDIDRRPIPATAKVQGFDHYTGQELYEYLASNGFAVRIIGPTYLHLGKFYARRKAG